MEIKGKIRRIRERKTPYFVSLNNYKNYDTNIQ